MGQMLAEGAAVPALRTYVVKKAKEESEIINARHKARELKGLGNARPQDVPAALRRHRIGFTK